MISSQGVLDLVGRSAGEQITSLVGGNALARAALAMSLVPAQGRAADGLGDLERLANQIRERLAILRDSPEVGISKIVREEDRLSVIPFLLLPENAPALTAVSGVFVKDGVSVDVKDSALWIFARALALVPRHDVESGTIARNLTAGVVDGIARTASLARADGRIRRGEFSLLKEVALRLPSEQQLEILPKVLKTCLAMRAKGSDYYDLAGMGVELAVASRSQKGFLIAAQLHGNVHITGLVGSDAGDWFRGTVSPLEEAFTTRATISQRARLADMIVREIADKPYHSQIREQERLLRVLYSLVQPGAKEFAPVMRCLSHLAMMERFGVWQQILGVISHWSEEAGLAAKKQRRWPGAAKRLLFKLRNSRRIDNHLSWERGDLDQL